MRELYIEDAEALTALCAELTGSPWLAIDTEFMREKTYYPRFCLLQIANEELLACVDPLALDDLDPLLDLLYDPSILKILHAARQDMELFFHLTGELPAPVFDTQVAATLAGFTDQSGYANVVKELLGIELEKGHARTDWSRRPLDRDQVRYALDDVRHLGPVYRALNERLERDGRLGWLQDDFQALTDPDTYRVHPRQAWQRLRGTQTLKGVQLAVAQGIAAWRETRAETSDRPRRWILKDEVVIDMARRMPKDTHGLGRIRGLSDGTLQRSGAELLDIIREARALPSERWPQAAAPPPRLNPQQEALADILMASVRLRGEQHSISPAMLTTRRELERLVSGERELTVLGGWRRAVLGKDLLAVLDGQLWPTRRDGRVELGTMPVRGQD